MQIVGIVGSGPAGLTAAIYCGRGGVQPVLLAGAPPGGQLMNTSEVENYPGFPHGINGPELVLSMREQATRFRTQVVDEACTAVDFSQRPFKLSTPSQTLQVDAVILAPGASPRWLGLASEQRLRGRGVSTCATCDGFFFRNQDVAVVGGGDSAMEEAIFLARLCRSVTVLTRSGRLRASHIMLQRAHELKNVTFIPHVQVEEVLGHELVTGVLLRDLQSEALRELKVTGLFVAIGHEPNTGFLRGHVELDREGYVTASHCTETNVTGVFVAGDVYDYRYRQAVTAAASGCKAALDCIRWLETGVPSTSRCL